MHIQGTSWMGKYFINEDVLPVCTDCKDQYWQEPNEKCSAHASPVSGNKMHQRSSYHPFGQGSPSEIAGLPSMELQHKPWNNKKKKKLYWQHLKDIKLSLSSGCCTLNIPNIYTNRAEMEDEKEQEFLRSQSRISLGPCYFPSFSLE